MEILNILENRIVQIFFLFRNNTSVWAWLFCLAANSEIPVPLVSICGFFPLGEENYVELAAEE